MSGFLKLFGIGGSKKEESNSNSHSSNHSRPTSQIIRNNNSNTTQHGGQPDEFADPHRPHQTNRRKASTGRPSQTQHFSENYPDPMRTTPLAPRPRSSKDFY